MIETKIEINKPFLSLKYDIENDVLTGDNVFNVNLIDLGDEVSDNNEITIEHDSDLIVSPSTFTIEFGIPQTVSVRLADDVVIPEGDFNFTLKLSNEYSTDENLVTSIVAKDEPGESPEDFVYKLKYFIQRQSWRLNIYENVLESVTLIPIEINGTCEMSRQERKDLFEPIIATTLDMNLEASLEMDLSDLYFEDERHFKVEVLRNNEIEFLGFILPDGIWKSFVSDKWMLKIKASDGLSSLKNTSFAQDIASIDGNPLTFFGRMTAFQIINICLNKSGLKLPININCQIIYFEWVGYNILSSIYQSVERYFQNDSEPMDCDAVMRSILQVFNATVVQQNGEWNIYRTIDLAPRMLWSKFTNGLYDQNIVKEFGSVLGSEINGSEIFHCNANQMESIAPSVQAYQVSYQYGGAKNILANGGLNFFGSVTDATGGINMPGWNIPSPPDGVNKVAAGVRVGYSYGVRSTIYGPDAEIIFLQLDQSIDVLSSNSLLLNIKYRNTGFNSTHLRFAFGVRDSNNIKQYYNVTTKEWINAGVMNEIANYHQPTQSTYKGNGDAVFSTEIYIPIDGSIFLEIFRNKNAPQQDGLMGVHNVSISASDNNIKSKDYTGRRKTKVSTSIKSNVTVYNGDSGSDLFVGTIFKSDSDTPTDGWNRYYMTESGGGWVKNDYPEFKEVLEINAEDNLKISPRPMTIFEGDFKGYIPYIDFFTIDSFKRMRFEDEEVDKKFQFTKWSYSFDTDITKMNCKEYSDEYGFGEDQFRVTIKENFSNEASVKIIG